ncbi:MAG: sensor histidine kinase, partial [Spirochaetales bacterium]|nr:sensor histidine kinase [Spirochaetales bacterium]
YRPIFYLVYGGIVCLVFIFSVWKELYKDWFVFIAVGLLAVLPLVLSNLFLYPHRRIGDIGNTEYLLFRNFPFLLMGLILLVRERGFLPVLFYSAIVILMILLLNGNRTVFGLKGLRPFGFLLFVFTITFLVIGLHINILVRKMKRQNEKLADFAVTREELVLSRERNRMARELHDTLAHTLSALSVQLETAKAYQDREPATAGSLIENALEVTRSGLKETRLALKALRASPLEDLGLALSLIQLLRETAERGHLKLIMDMPEKFPLLSSSTEQCLYRITQEGTANILHHAGATCLEVSLSFNRGILLRIKDNGRGFNRDDISGNDHYGLKGMEERAYLAGGELKIDSLPGRGTEIVLRLEDCR